jgi:hypothetical protein
MVDGRVGQMLLAACAGHLLAVWVGEDVGDVRGVVGEVVDGVVFETG